MVGKTKRKQPVEEEEEEDIDAMLDIAAKVFNSNNSNKKAKQEKYNQTSMVADKLPQSFKLHSGLEGRT